MLRDDVVRDVLAWEGPGDIDVVSDELSVGIKGTVAEVLGGVGETVAEVVGTRTVEDVLGDCARSEPEDPSRSAR